MKILNCLALFLFIFGTYSCSKNETTNTTSKTPKEVLIESQWKKSEYKENGVVTPFFGSCEMDDILTFASNGNYTMSEGANMCSGSSSSTDFYFIETDNKTFRWGLYGVGEISFNSSFTSFTFKRTGANTFEYIFVKK